MTSPPEHRAEPLAALGVKLDSLRRHAEQLATKVDDLASTQRQHAVLLNGVAELRTRIDHIHSLLTSENDETPATWFWLTMPDQERHDKLAELADWVDTVLHAQYPGYLASHIRPCWPNHPEARWELAWLYQLWTQAYLADLTAPKDAADWHDRWAPGVLHRLSALMRGCADSCKGLTEHA